MSEENNNYQPPNEAFEINRQRIDINVGCLVQQGKKIYKITQILDFETLIAIEMETNISVSLRINDLTQVKDVDLPQTAHEIDISNIASKDWKTAETRYAAIQPLLNKGSFGRKAVSTQAKKAKVNTATLYRWLKKYQAYGVVSALIPQKRGWKQGNTRLPNHATEIIDEVIDDYYLTIQRPTVQKTVTEVLCRCEQRGLPAPHPNSIRARINSVAEKKSLRKRGYREKAKNKFIPAAGKFPNADYPLAVIQIDHTPADIILVDDVYRKPIGRPWITLAMDINTRMVTGYYLSFDPPSETSVAMCVSHSILPKEEWLTLHNVDSQWPVWGVPATIHVDNGADFRSNNFQKSCLMYGINLEFRPVKQPQYGGHIERILGTFLQEIHSLPGTTFSSIKDRDEYDSEKHAVMTKSEFETWLVGLICDVYHRRIHTSIGMTPIRKWELGIFGTKDELGCGLPAKVSNRLTLLLDFLPSFERTVQTFGVTIDGMSYYAEAIRPWINQADPAIPGQKIKLTFRRDPRDISIVWFFDPTLKEYFKVPFADQTLPAMSIWEYKKARDILRKEGAKSVNERQVLRAITELRNQVEESKEKTKKARRMSQRRKEHEKNISPANPVPPPKKPLANNKSSFADLLVDDVEPFEDIG